MPTWEETKRAGQTAFISQETDLQDVHESIGDMYRQILQLPIADFTEGRMFDDIFSFIDPIVELSEDDMFHSTVKMVEVYFDLMEKKGMDRTKSLPQDLSGAVVICLD